MEIKVIVPEVTLATVVESIYRDPENGEEYPVTETIGDKVAEIIAREVMKSPEYATLRQRVTEIRTDEIRAQLRPIIADAIQTPLRRTNSWGEPVGELTTLRELIMHEAQSMWSTTKRDSFSREPHMMEIIRQAVRDHATDQIQRAVLEAREAVLKVVKDLAGQPIVDAVRKALEK